jgi:hypothetical protein
MEANDKVVSTITVCSEWLVGYHDNDKVFSTITVCSEWLVGYHDNDKVFSTITGSQLTIHYKQK